MNHWVADAIHLYKKNSYGGFDKARHFDDFFGSPNEDDFRSAMQGKRESNNYDNSYNDYNRYRKEPYFPKSVAPVPPPLGFKRVNRCSANTTNANSSIKTDQLKPGIRIKHERFGSGTLIGTEGTGENAKIRVEFDDAGIKNLLVKFARFTILGWYLTCIKQTNSCQQRTYTDIHSSPTSIHKLDSGIFFILTYRAAP